MALTLELIAGNSPTIQLYVRGALDVVGAPVGSPIAGVAQLTNTWVYDFSMVGVAYADYWVQLDGISTPDGLPFPLRLKDSGVYYADHWWLIDATVTATPTIPPAISGLCNVLFAVTHNAIVVEGASVVAVLEDQNNTLDGYLEARTVESGFTDASGFCTLTLVQYGEFLTGGNYRIRVKDSYGKLLCNRLVVIPNTLTANAQDLVDA